MTDGEAPTRFKYFAYGSNMCTRRLIARTPSAKPVAAGYAQGRRLTFDKVSRDGSGKCDAHWTGMPADRIFGVVFEIASSERAALDQAEGLGSGYAAQTVTVLASSGAVQALTYVATHKESMLRPYHWYKALVVAGAVEHALPTEYVEWIRAVESMEDPNPKRRSENEALDRLLIQTPSLTLRPFVPEDASKIFRMSQEERLRTWLPNQVYRDEKHAASVLESLIAQCRAPGNPRLGPYVLGVELRTTGDLIGHVGFSPYSGAVEVGFAIEQAHQRKGVASEAVRAASEWASTAFSLETILGIAAAQNVAAQAVLLRAGYSWQKAEVARFQGVEQPVVFFAFCGQPTPKSGAPDAVR